MSRGKSIARSARQSTNKLGLARCHRRARFESLEARQLLSITLPTVADQTVLAGAPLNLGLDVTSSTGNAVDYTVSVSNSSLLTATVPNGNPSLKLTVDDDVNNIHGVMVFQLSEDLTPETVAKITDLVNSDFYDGLTFHRIIENFMIQGGDPNGDGTGGSGTVIDDEFTTSLQFTSPGLLAMANSGDDTNDSQFFITTDETRWLDFNHTIFGVLTEGSDVLAQLNAVATDSNDKPLSDVVITDAEIISDTQDGVLRLSAANGTSGSATVTVTATDSVTGDSTSQTFDVTVAADTTNDPPFIGQIDPIVTTVDAPVTFTIPATDTEGDAIYCAGSVVSPTDSSLTLSVNSSTGQVTVTPTAGLAPGDYSIQVKVAPTASSTTWDTQLVTVTVVNSAPTDIAISNASVKEGLVAGTTVGTLSTADANSGDTFTYSLVSGTGSTNNALFTISDGVLKTAAVFDYDTATSYTIRVRSTDAGGLYVEEAFTINVTDTSSTPSAITLDNTSVEEGKATGTTVGNFKTTDQDGNTSFAYTLVSGDGSTNNGLFTIDAKGVLKTSAVFDYDNATSYTIRVRSTDVDGLYVENAFTISVTKANSAPTNIALSTATVADGDTVVGTFSTTDSDAGNTFTYAWASGIGSTDNSLFTLETSADGTATTLVLKNAASYATQGSYSIRVQSTDQGGLSTVKTFTITVLPAPTDITLTNNNGTSVTQGTVVATTAIGTIVGTLGTTSPKSGDTFIYSLVSGTGSDDNSSFKISGSTLLTAKEFAYSTTDNTYTIRVRTTSSSGLTYDEAFTINVINGNITLTGGAVAEDSPIGTAVGVLSATHTGTSTAKYSLVSGDGSTDNSSFSLVGTTLYTKVTLDYETQSTYSIRVRCTNSDGVIQEESFTITVTQVSNQPTDIALSNATVLENQTSGTTVGTLSTTDLDANDVFTYALVSGDCDATTEGVQNDNAKFTISGNTLKTAEKFTYTAGKTYLINVRSMDSSGNTYTEVFRITVTNSATAMTLSDSEVVAGDAVGTKVGTLKTSYLGTGNDTFAYSLVSGTGDTNNSLFEIDENGDLLTVAVFDYNVATSYSIRVRSTAATSKASIEQTFTITVLNGSITLVGSTVKENQPVGTVVGTLSLDGASDNLTYTYSLVSGTGSTDNSSFTIVGSTLKTSAKLDYETKTSYSVRVKCTDSTGETWERAFEIKVTEVNEEPTGITLSDSAIDATVVVGTVVGVFTTTDPDKGSDVSYTYTRDLEDSSYPDNAAFTINSNGELVTAKTFDYNTQSTYTIRVRTTDQGTKQADGEWKDMLYFEKTFTITINEVNEAPSDITLSNATVLENVAIGTTVGTLTTTDPDGDSTFTYLLVAGTKSNDNSLFTISGSTLKTNQKFTYEAGKTYTVRVRSSDAAGASTEKEFTITVTNSGTAIKLSKSDVAEQAAVGTVVGKLTTNNLGLSTDMFTYTLVSGTGDTNNSQFTIDANGNLVTNAVLDYDTATSLIVRIRSTASASNDTSVKASGQFTEQTFVITVIDVPKITDVMVAEVATPVNDKLEAKEKLAIQWNVEAANSVASLFVTVDGTNIAAISQVSSTRYSATCGTFAVGSHTYTIKVIDSKGGVATYDGTFDVEASTPPTISGVTVAESETVNGTLDVSDKIAISWNLSSENGLSWQSLTVDGQLVQKIYGPYSTGVTGLSCYSGVAGPLAAGSHTYTISALDGRGVTGTYTGTFTVAAVSATQQGAYVFGAAVVEETGIRDGVLTTSEPIFMSWSATIIAGIDGIAGATLYVDGTAVTKVYGPYATSSGANFGASLGTLSAGTHTYSIVAKDKAGNVTSTACTGSFTVVAASTTTDQAGPKVSGVMVVEEALPRDGILTASDSLVMTWNAVDPSGVASATLYVDGKAITDVRGPYATVSGVNFAAMIGTLAAGTHSYSITATDKLGNVTAVAYEGSFEVVASAASVGQRGPVVSGVMVVEEALPRDGILTASDPLVMTWNAVDPDGVASATLFVDGTAMTDVRGPYATVSGVNFAAMIGTLAAGTHSYSITATDKLGNVTAAACEGSFEVGSALMIEESALLESSVAQLTDAELEPIVVEAMRRLEEAFGIQASTALAGVTVRLADLSTGLLGEATDKVITIDRDAAGYGWFVDSTPADDVEFVETLASDELAARTDSAASGRVDLLTAVMHEMGHVLGYGHASVLDLMEPTLSVGERKDVAKS